MNEKLIKENSREKKQTNAGDGKLYKSNDLVERATERLDRTESREPLALKRLDHRTDTGPQDRDWTTGQTTATDRTENHALR